MDMNRTFYLRKEDRNPQWQVIDATGQSVGRLAVKIADTLRGKNDPMYTPHTDSGDYVVVVNALKVVFTGDKWNMKEYVSHSGYLGNRRVVKAKDLMKKDPTAIILHAVKLMLPKNNLSKQILKKLKIYTGAEHKHQAQVPAA